MEHIGVLDILLIILIVYVIFLWYRSSRLQIEYNSNEKFYINNKKYKKNKPDNFKDMFDVQSDVLDLHIFDHNTKKHKRKNNLILKPYFMGMQFHNDYRDTITAFNDIAPSQKEIFNYSSLPTDHTDPPHEEVHGLIKEFIRQLNKNIKYNVSHYRSSNTGWDEPIPDIKGQSGWDKQQEELGLPTSLYSDPAKKSPVKLIKIDDVEKYTTESETKYICTIIIQKINIEDQMIVKISFVKNNRDINGDRQFFKDLEMGSLDTNTSQESSEINIMIEEIFIVGFLTDQGIQRGNITDNFYNFKGLETNDIIDDKTIMKELIKKYINKSKDDLIFAASLDEQGSLFHDGLRDISTYDAFKCTRSIYDDLNGKPIIYE